MSDENNTPPAIGDVPEQVAEQIAKKPLTVHDIVNLQAAIAKLADLEAQVIKTKTGEAEKEGLRAFLVNTLVAHASELISNWVVLNNEYAQLIQGVRGLLNQVSHSNAIAAQQRAQQHAAAQAATKEQEPTNIIKL